MRKKPYPPIRNPVPHTLARVVPGEGPFSTLGPPGTSDVFVTAADDMAGLNAQQLANRLGIRPSESFTVISRFRSKILGTECASADDGATEGYVIAQNYLDEFGNVADASLTHGIEVYSK